MTTPEFTPIDRIVNLAKYMMYVLRASPTYHPSDIMYLSNEEIDNVVPLRPNIPNLDYHHKSPDIIA